MKEFNTNKKALPVTYPIVTSYPTYANIFSIFSDNEEDLIWFYAQYFQLAMSKNDGSILDFGINSSINYYIMKICPLLDFHAIGSSLIDKNSKSIIDFIVSAIDEGYYLHMNVDTYEIPAYTRNYKKRHFGHDLMLYGYDKNTKTFNIADFFDGKYEFKTATFDEIYKGHVNFPDYNHRAVLLKKTHITQTNLDIAKIKNIINDYLSSANAMRYMDYDFYFADFLYGVEVYNLLKERIESGCVNITDFHLLYDHKTILLGLVNQLHKESHLKNNEYLI